MAYFDWAEDMVVDRGVIDQDHRTLIALVNELHSATRDGQGHAVVGRVLEALIRYTGEHFSREEQLMARLGYRDREEHGAGHRRLVDQVEHLRQRHSEGSIASAAQVSALLRDWLSLHIRRDDRALRDLLLARQPGRMRAQEVGTPGDGV